MRETAPIDHGLPGYGWTTKKVGCLCRQWYGSSIGTIGRTTLYRYLHQVRLSWKKCQKVLAKANPKRRADFVQEMEALYARLCTGAVRVLYLDESHIHRDLETGYTWATTGETAWRKSDCPPLADRINCYGAYDFVQGQCFIWQDGPCNQAQTVTFLQRLAEWLGDVKTPTVLIWDGAPWHRASAVQQAAQKLGFTLMPLPAYSPDLNPIEQLWKWMRSEVTHHHCHASVTALFEACLAFITRINAEPELLVKRLWPKFELDPEYEKLLIST